MEHRTRLSEANEMRKLMGLPIMVEQFDPNEDPAGESYRTEMSYDLVAEYAAAIEKWWQDENDEVTNFFAPDKGMFLIGNDDEDAAAKRYKTLSDTFLAELLSVDIDGGKDNPYYKQLKDWLDKIVDEIDDGFWFFGGQDPVNLYITSPDGTKSGTFTVDPEAT